MKKVAILQSNYIPWKGYFDLIAAVDEFVLYDDVQFTKNDWRNRNEIKTDRGKQWITVPVGQKISRLIREVTLPNTDWQAKHWALLCQNYYKAKYFDCIAPDLEELYLHRTFTSLSELNRTFLEVICQKLDIKTKISNSWDYELREGKTERLVSVCKQAGATEYISGPSAQGYLDVSLFDQESIDVTWFHYQGYKEYPQLWGEFCHSVTILDLLFNCGAESRTYMRY